MYQELRPFCLYFHKKQGPLRSKQQTMCWRFQTHVHMHFITPRGRQTTEEQKEQYWHCLPNSPVKLLVLRDPVRPTIWRTVGAGVRVVRVQTSVAVGTCLFCVDGWLDAFLQAGFHLIQYIPFRRHLFRVGRSHEPICLQANVLYSCFIFTSHYNSVEVRRLWSLSQPGNLSHKAQYH